MGGGAADPADRDIVFWPIFARVVQKRTPASPILTGCAAARVSTASMDSPKLAMSTEAKRPASGPTASAASSAACHTSSWWVMRNLHGHRPALRAQLA